MSTEYLKEIVGRHFLIILKIATKAADGKVFSDLFGNLENCAQIASLVLEPKFLPLLKNGKTTC